MSTCPRLAAVERDTSYKDNLYVTKMDMDKIVVLPCTLFHQLAASGDDHLYIVEHPVFFRETFSKAKLGYTKAAVLAFCRLLQANGKQFTHVSLQDYARWKKTLKDDRVVVFDPTDRDVVADLQSAAMQVLILEAPNFLTSTDALRQYHAAHPAKQIHKTFYEWQRRRTGILMRNGKPVGGKYSWDADNRQKVPRDHVLPTMPHAADNEDLCRQVADSWVTEFFPHAPGSLERMMRFPITHEASQKWLAEFTRSRLPSFGRFEDAVVRDNPLLYHSGLSPMLLLGLLTPHQVLDAVLDAKRIPLSSLEGFVRQVVGFREFCRYIYIFTPQDMTTPNFLNADRKLTKAWYDGTTGLEPLDDAIRDAFDHGYLHHIRRLMIVGSAMTLCGVHPAEVRRWMTEFSQDSQAWLMAFNGEMVSFASGGQLTTKPYVTASNYILKMSDYKKGPWCDVWDALYYNFHVKHAERLRGVRQAIFATNYFNKLSKVRQEAMLATARNFIRDTTGYGRA